MAPRSADAMAPAPAMSRRAVVHRLSMRHPGDVSALEALIESGEVEPSHIVAVIGKTEGNGGVNDFTRGYFTQSLMSMLARVGGGSASEWQARLPCILSGGTEGVLSPHCLVLCRSGVAGEGEPSLAAAGQDGPAVQASHDGTAGRAGDGALAIGVAISDALLPEQVGRAAQVQVVSDTVRRAMADAGLDAASEVVLVQLKCPAVTVAAAQAARSRGHEPVSADPNRAMAFSRAAGALGVAHALGETAAAPDDLARAALNDFSCRSGRASVSSGIEVTAIEAVVLGMSRRWAGDLRIACRPLADALDIEGAYAVLEDLGLCRAGQRLRAQDAGRIVGVLVKCEPDRHGLVRGQRHTMLDDTDINAQRHIRAAVGGMVAGVLGDGRLFVSGGAEHQGPDGGGLIAVIARGMTS